MNSSADLANQLKACSAIVLLLLDSNAFTCYSITRRIWATEQWLTLMWIWQLKATYRCVQKLFQSCMTLSTTSLNGLLLSCFLRYDIQILNNRSNLYYVQYVMGPLPVTYALDLRKLNFLQKQSVHHTSVINLLFY